jgi:hypothetical protein
MCCRLLCAQQAMHDGAPAPRPALPASSPHARTPLQHTTRSAPAKISSAFSTLPCLPYALMSAVYVVALGLMPAAIMRS